MDLLDALEKLAKAATPGPWKPHDRGPAYDFSPTNILSGDGQKIAQRVDYVDAAFIAAANPATVLKLIAEVRDLRGKLDGEV